MELLFLMLLGAFFGALIATVALVIFADIRANVFERKEHYYQGQYDRMKSLAERFRNHCTDYRAFIYLEPRLAELYDRWYTEKYGLPFETPAPRAELLLPGPAPLDTPLPYMKPKALQEALDKLEATAALGDPDWLKEASTPQAPVH